MIKLRRLETLKWRSALLCCRTALLDADRCVWNPLDCCVSQRAGKTISLTLFVPVFKSIQPTKYYILVQSEVIKLKVMLIPVILVIPTRIICALTSAFENWNWVLMLTKAAPEANDANNHPYL